MCRQQANRKNTFLCSHPSQQVKSAWILCLLRDESPESGMEHYIASLPYRDMIVGIGLDSNEDQRPPSLFEEIYLRARADGFRLTAHCDVGKAYPIEHVHQVVTSVSGTGAERVDHGLNATDSPELMALMREKGVGMTICPWSYIRHQPFDEVFKRLRSWKTLGFMRICFWCRGFASSAMRI
jgi:adenosine deaminase